MHKETFFTEMAAAMMRRAWPAKQARRIMREVRDHWEELEHESREAGFDAAAAQNYARQRIGDAGTLIDSYEEAMRSGSWAGRHPILSFIVLPPVALVLWFLAWTGMAAGAGELYAAFLKLNTPSWGSYLVVLIFAKVILYTGVFAVPAFFCWWARGSFRGMNWCWAACSMCALHGLLNHVTVGAHHLQWAYGIASVDWITVLAPVLVAICSRLVASGAQARCPAALVLASALLMGCASGKTPQERGWIGGEYKGVTHAKESCRGLLVTALRTNTPAARSGLREGDLILGVDGIPVRNVRAFRAAIDAKQPGTVLSLRVLRGGSAVEMPVQMGRETYTLSRSVVVGILMSREIDPWPNPEFSLVALGYKCERDRLDLTSPESQLRLQDKTADASPGLRSSEGWELWLPVISFSSRKRILSQD